MYKPPFTIRWGRVAIVALLAIALWCIPLEWIDQKPTICLIKRFIGHECWGCGMTRAFFQTLHGNIQAAISLNWRCLIVFPLLGVLVLRQLVRFYKADN